MSYQTRRIVNGVLLSPHNSGWTAIIGRTTFVFDDHKGKWTLWEDEAWGPKLPISHRKTLKACVNDAVLYAINAATEKGD